MDLTFRKGDTSQAWSLRLLDEGASEISLDNYEFYMEIRDLRGHKQELRALGKGLSIEQNQLIIEKRQRESLPEGFYTYALKMRTHEGDLVTFLEGKLTIKNQIVYEN